MTLAKAAAPQAPGRRPVCARRAARWRSPRAAWPATRSTAARASARPGRACIGKTETLADGSTALVDEAYLRGFIRDPQARDVKGFPPVMPQIELTDDELDALVAYIKAQSDRPPQR